MRKAQIIVAATYMFGVGLTALPLEAAAAQQHPVKKHHKLATAAAGVGAYELAKHSHNKFIRKHRFAAGVVGAVAAHHYMKKHDQKMVKHHH